VKEKEGSKMCAWPVSIVK